MNKRAGLGYNNVGLLLVGIAVTALSGSRGNVALLGWVASTPWLLYLRRSSCKNNGWLPLQVRDAMLFLAAVQIGIFLNILKIVTDFIPWMFVPFTSIPAAFLVGVTLLAFEQMRQILGDAWGLVLFPSFVVSLEFINGTVMGQSSWGSLAYTQLDDLALLQVVSLCGLGGLSYLLATSSAVVAVLLDNHHDHNPARYRPVAAVVMALVLATRAWGSWRLNRPLPAEPMITVATVGSDLAFAIEMPSKEELDHANEILLDRTRSAAKAGADLIIWNEVATVAPTREDEATLLARGEDLARDAGVDIVMGYSRLIDDDDKDQMMTHFENKFVWMSPQGPTHTYHKHHPVPGFEGAVPGTEPHRVLTRPWGKAAGAICYDYDFPKVGLAHAQGGAGLVAVPASDWRGIDPFHTQMASVRGIEGGFAVVRSVRMATSGAYDAYGRALATSSWFRDTERIMLARVPVTPLPTLYSQIGDVFPMTCVGVVVMAAAVAAIHRFHNKATTAKGSSFTQSNSFGSEARRPAKAKAA